MLGEPTGVWLCQSEETNANRDKGPDGNDVGPTFLLNFEEIIGCALSPFCDAHGHPESEHPALHL